jgi:hypothetical protein
VLTVKTDKWAFDPKAVETPGLVPSEVKP